MLFTQYTLSGLYHQGKLSSVSCFFPQSLTTGWKLVEKILSVVAALLCLRLTGVLYLHTSLYSAFSNVLQALTDFFFPICIHLMFLYSASGWASVHVLTLISFVITSTLMYSINVIISYLCCKNFFVLFCFVTVIFFRQKWHFLFFFFDSWIIRKGEDL